MMRKSNPIGKRSHKPIILFYHFCVVGVSLVTNSVVAPSSPVIANVSPLPAAQVIGQT